MDNSNRFNILVVDDILENIQVALNILKEDSYSFSYAVNGVDALLRAQEQKFDLILLDIMMPNINGFEVCKRLKQEQLNQDTPIIFLTAKSDIDSISAGFELGCVDYVTKPFHPAELLARVATHIQLSASKKLLKQENIQLAIKNKIQRERFLSEIEENQRELIYVLMEMMESTSDETGQHIRRVADLCKLLASYVGYLEEEEINTLYHAAPMHDLGKIAIPKAILHKQGKLTEEEFEVMKTHTIKGAEFLQNSKRKLFEAASIIALQHHEKWDGSGYPNGLKGEDIHIFARILALADVFDALTHKRCYKDSWTIPKAVDYIKSMSGTQFDPNLVKLFVQHLDEFIVIVTS